MMQTLFGVSFWASLFVVANILFMETMLSVDNAAVLAVMVGKLPAEQRPKALEYGIWGAFILRGAALCLVSILISIWWLKVVGGLYLIYLCYGHFSAAEDTVEEIKDPEQTFVVHFAEKYLKLNVFWATVCLVEAMDMAFSMDNIFAVTSFTSYIGLIIIGVFIGIVCMRFVAAQFVKLMEKFPFLEDIAYIVIGLLGVKLALTLYFHFTPDSQFTKALTGEHADLYTSLVTICIFFIPVLTSLLFNFPKKPVPPVPTPTTAEASVTIEEMQGDAE